MGPDTGWARTTALAAPRRRRADRWPAPARRSLAVTP